MLTILSVTFPFFALVFAGYLAARRGWLPLAAIPGLTLTPPDATYVLFFGLPPGSEAAEAVVERLQRRHGVALVPGSPRWFGPGGAGHLRLCFATSEAILAEGLRRVARGLAERPEAPGA